MSKLKYNFISAWAVLSFLLAPLGAEVALARTVMVDSGVRFYPTTYQNTTTTNTNTDTTTTTDDGSLCPNGNTMASNCTVAPTSATSTDTRQVTYRNIYLADGIADRFSSRYTTDSSAQTIAYQPPTDINSEYGRLAASAVVGSEGFWPSGILQWFLVFILLIVIIALFRYIKGSKQTYHASPMKHA